MAVSVGALPHKEAFAEAALVLLIKHGAVVYDRLDCCACSGLSA